MEEEVEEEEEEASLAVKIVMACISHKLLVLFAFMRKTISCTNNIDGKC